MSRGGVLMKEDQLDELLKLDKEGTNKKDDS